MPIDWEAMRADAAKEKAAVQTIDWAAMARDQGLEGEDVEKVKEVAKAAPSEGMVKDFIHGLKGGAMKTGAGLGNMVGLVSDEKEAEIDEQYQNREGWADNIGSFIGDTAITAPIGGAVGAVGKKLYQGGKMLKRGVDAHRATKAAKMGDKAHGLKMAKQADEMAKQKAAADNFNVSSKLMEGASGEVKDKLQDRAKKSIANARHTGEEVARHQSEFASEGLKRAVSAAGTHPVRMAGSAADKVGGAKFLGDRATDAISGAAMADEGNRGQAALQAAGLGSLAGGLNRGVRKAAPTIEQVGRKGKQYSPYGSDAYKGSRFMHQVGEDIPRTSAVRRMDKRGTKKGYAAARAVDGVRASALANISQQGQETDWGDPKASAQELYSNALRRLQPSGGN